MRTGLRQLTRDFAIYGLGEVLVKAVGFLTLPIYTRLFTPDDYGILNFATTVVGLIMAILVLGGDSAYARFYFEARTPEQKRVVTSTWIGFLGAWSLVVTAFLLLPLSGQIARLSFGGDEQTLLMFVALLGAPLSLINAMLGQVLRNQFRARTYTILNLASVALNIGLGVFAVVGLRLGLVGILAGMAAAGAIQLPVRVWTTREMFRPVFSAGLLRQMLAFGLPLVPTSLAYWVFLTSDRLLLGKLSTLEQLGLYSVAVSVSGLLGLANSAFGQAWGPHGVHAYEETPDTAPAFFGRVMTYLLAGMGVLCVGITVFGSELLTVLTRPPFYPAAAAIGPLAIAMVAYASVQVSAAGISLKKQTKYFAVYSWAAAILNVVLNVLLDGPYGMMGAAWATTVSYVFLTLAYLVTAQRLWRVAYETRRSLTIVGLTIAFTFGAGWLAGPTPLVTVVLKGAYCLLFLAAIFVLRGFDQRETRVLRSILSRA